MLKAEEPPFSFCGGEGSILKKREYTLKLTFSAMFIALYFVLDRFAAINLPSNQYKLSFIPLILAAVFLGPLWGMAVGGLGDLVSALIMPTGPYFPGFTVVSALMGLTIGLLCYKKLTAPRAVLAVFLCQGIGGLVLNTLNLAFYFIVNGIGTYGESVGAIIGALALSRAIQAGIYFVVKVLFMLLLIKIKPRLDAVLPWSRDAAQDISDTDDAAKGI